MKIAVSFEHILGAIRGEYASAIVAIKPLLYLSYLPRYII